LARFIFKAAVGVELISTKWLFGIFIKADIIVNFQTFFGEVAHF
jgi:hypothetical protein